MSQGSVRGGWPVLRPGDWVHYDGGEHQVVTLTGTAVRLRAAAGGQSVVLAAHLMSAPGFSVIDGEPLPEMTPFGLLEGLPAEVLDAAREWERHVVEVVTGLPQDAAPGTVGRPEHDPALRTVRERDQAKADELGVSAKTVQNRRLRYLKHGLWGLVDQRALREAGVTGRADARLVAAIQDAIAAETNTSTGTRSRLIRRVTKALEDTYGPGVVPVPAKTTFYRLIGVLATGRHTFGSAVTRRQAANRPDGPFTPTAAVRPGEQVQVDSTPLDVMVLLDGGVAVRAELTIAVDVATRTICAAVLRPVGTKAVDAALLLARMLVPEPMRPGWSASLAMAASRLPHVRLVDVDTRMEQAAAKPVIVPDTIVIDGGRVFISDTFIRACERLGISVQKARPGTPTDKAIVEATFSAINTLWCQHLPGNTGRDVTRRGRRPEAEAAWSVPELQDLLDEWVVCGWQHRPHDSLRDPYFPRRAMSPNDAYASQVAAAGYLPLVLTGEDYLELLPVAWRAINDYGIRIDYRTYDVDHRSGHDELGPYRRQNSGIAAKKGLWEVHYDPYDLSQVFVRTRDGWITVPWIHQAMASAPFADFTWRHARRLAAERGLDDTNETDVARVLDELLTRAEAGPGDRRGDRRTDRVAGRTKVAAETHRPPRREAEPSHPEPAPDRATGEVVPFGIFDAAAEAEKWI
jgi:transposase InsO family protein